jgi:hypothetical protein
MRPRTYTPFAFVYISAGIPGEQWWWWLDSVTYQASFSGYIATSVGNTLPVKPGDLSPILAVGLTVRAAHQSCPLTHLAKVQVPVFGLSYMYLEVWYTSDFDINRQQMKAISCIAVFLS